VIESGLIASAGIDRDARRRRVDEIVALVGLEKHVDNTIGELSGGQLQRALLGRAIIARPRVLVLDEPLSYVDKHFESRIYEIVARLASHTTILLVSHEMSTIAGMANRHLIIDRQLRECRFTHHYARSGCDCADC
ncbi:MAG: ATP-binding cassette domain-containing protein, partial [Muribaculaceae bacterium]|nr:ATP-binding cassette domain-containing protein [Muribaculaceae bacterium]